MIFHENCLLADVLMKYHTLFFRKHEKMSSAAVVIGALTVKDCVSSFMKLFMYW